MAVILEISALNKYVRSLLDSDTFLSDIAVRGEISNFNRNYKTGHCYFSLTDPKSSLKAVMFRAEAERLAFRPENGMVVVARGRVSLYERDGAYQIYVDALFEEGAGAQKNAFDLLKERLAQEGLFDAKTKKPLPAMPWKIGLITSKTGAALQDIVQVSQRRNPCARLVLAPVRVQGQGAAEEVAAALQTMDIAALDVIIIARGGGSAEDLSVFNDENLVRRVYAASTPVVSAIGHEIDFTLLDFVADLRAPTPSAAAELVLPSLAAMLAEKETLCMNHGRNIHNLWQLCYNQMQGALRHPSLQVPASRAHAMEMDIQRKVAELMRHMKEKMDVASGSLQECMHLAGSLNPYGVMQRGYAVVKKQGHTVATAARLQAGDAISIQFWDGAVQAAVQNTLLEGKVAADEQKDTRD